MGDGAAAGTISGGRGRTRAALVPTVCHHLATIWQAGAWWQSDEHGPRVRLVTMTAAAAPTRVCDTVCAVVFLCGGGAELVAGIAGIFRGEPRVTTNYKRKKKTKGS